MVTAATQEAGAIGGCLGGRAETFSSVDTLRNVISSVALRAAVVINTIDFYLS